MTAKSKYPIILPTASTIRRAEYDSRGPLSSIGRNTPRLVDHPYSLYLRTSFIYFFIWTCFGVGCVLEVVSMQCNVYPTTGFIELANKARYTGQLEIAKKAKRP